MPFERNWHAFVVSLTNVTPPSWPSPRAHYSFIVLIHRLLYAVALPSMSKAEVAGLLRSLVTTTPISPPLQPLFRELVRALEAPADRVHLTVLGEHRAAYNVPAEAIFELPHATRAAVWTAAPARFSIDLAATTALVERDVASLAPLHALTMRIGTHAPAPPPPALGLQPSAGPGASAAASAASAAAAAAFAATAAGPARRRLAVTAELVACVRGDARRYDELARHITACFTRTRDGRWAQLRSDVYVAHFQAAAPQQGLPRDPCGQLILEREELLRGKASAAAAMLRTIRAMIALAAARADALPAQAAGGGSGAGGGAEATARLANMRKAVADAARETVEYARSRGGGALHYIVEAKRSFEGSPPGAYEAYLSRIAPGRPMDYETLRSSRAAKYSSWEEALADARSICENARRYWGGAHPLVSETEALFAHFEAAIERARLAAAGGASGVASSHKLGVASPADILCVLGDPQLQRACVQLVVRDALLPSLASGRQVHETPVLQPAPAQAARRPAAATAAGGAGAAGGQSGAAAAGAAGAVAARGVSGAAAGAAGSAPAAAPSMHSVSDAALCALFLLALGDCAYMRVRQGAALVPGSAASAAIASAPAATAGGGRGRGGSAAGGSAAAAARARLAYQRPELLLAHMLEVLGPAPPPAPAPASGAPAPLQTPVLPSSLAPHLQLATRCLQNLAMELRLGLCGSSSSSSSSAGSSSGLSGSSGGGGLSAAPSSASLSALAPAGLGDSAAATADGSASDVGPEASAEAAGAAAVVACGSKAVALLYRVLRRGRTVHSRSVCALVGAFAGFYMKAPATPAQATLLHALSAIATAPGSSSSSPDAAASAAAATSASGGFSQALGDVDPSLPLTLLPCLYTGLLAAATRDHQVATAAAAAAASGSATPSTPPPLLPSLLHRFIEQLALPWVAAASRRPDARAPVHELLISVVARLLARGVLPAPRAAGVLMRALGSLSGSEAVAAAAAAAATRVATAAAAGSSAAGGSGSGGLGLSGTGGMTGMAGMGMTGMTGSGIGMTPATYALALPGGMGFSFGSGPGPGSGLAGMGSGGATGAGAGLGLGLGRTPDPYGDTGATAAAAAVAASAGAPPPPPPAGAGARAASASAAAGSSGAPQSRTAAAGPLENTLASLHPSVGAPLSSYLSDGWLSPLAVVFTRPDFAPVALAYARLLTGPQLRAHVDFAALGLSPAFLLALTAESLPGVSSGTAGGAGAGASAGAPGSAAAPAAAGAGLQLLLPAGSMPPLVASALYAAAAPGAGGGTAGSGMGVSGLGVGSAGLVSTALFSGGGAMMTGLQFPGSGMGTGGGGMMMPSTAASS